MDIQQLYDQLHERFGDDVRGLTRDVLDPWIEIAPQRLLEVCRHLKAAPAWRFDLLNCITAVDFFEPDPKKAAKSDWKPHLEVLYHLSSTVRKHMCLLKVMLPRWKDDVAGELPELPSVRAN